MAKRYGASHRNRRDAPIENLKIRFMRGRKIPRGLRQFIILIVT